MSASVKADCGKNIELALKNYIFSVNESNYKYLSECASEEALSSYVESVEYFVNKFPALALRNPTWNEALQLLKVGKINNKQFFIRVKEAKKAKEDQAGVNQEPAESFEYVGFIKEKTYTHALYRSSSQAELVLSRQPKVFSYIFENGQWKYAYFPYL